MQRLYREYDVRPMWQHRRRVQKFAIVPKYRRGFGLYVEQGVAASRTIIRPPRTSDVATRSDIRYHGGGYQ